MKRLVQVFLYVQMVVMTVVAVVEYLGHQLPIAAEEQPLAREVGFLLLGLVVILWVVSRFWQEESRLLLIPIAFAAAGLVNQGLNVVIVNAKLDLPVPFGADYTSLVVNGVAFVVYIVGYAWAVARSHEGASPAIPHVA